MSEQLQKQIIARFISYDDAIKHVLAPDSATFGLQSTRYYREQAYERPNDLHSDRNEAEPSFSDGDLSADEWLTSCWVRLDKSEVDWAKWSRVFSGRPIAVISTVDKVRDLIKQRLGWWQNDFQDDKVEYYDDGDWHKIRNQFHQDPYRLVFWKHCRYKNQEEYRFALRLTLKQSSSITLTFSIHPFEDADCLEYIDSIWVRSLPLETIRDDEQKKKMCKLVASAGLRKIPVNFLEGPTQEFKWRDQQCA